MKAILAFMLAAAALTASAARPGAALIAAPELCAAWPAAPTAPNTNSPAHTIGADGTIEVK